MVAELHQDFWGAIMLPRAMVVSLITTGMVLLMEILVVTGSVSSLQRNEREKQRCAQFAGCGNSSATRQEVSQESLQITQGSTLAKYSMSSPARFVCRIRKRKIKCYWLASSTAFMAERWIHLAIAWNSVVVSHMRKYNLPGMPRCVTLEM